LLSGNQNDEPVLLKSDGLSGRRRGVPAAAAGCGLQVTVNLDGLECRQRWPGLRMPAAVTVALNACPGWDDAGLSRAECQCHGGVIRSCARAVIQSRDSDSLARSCPCQCSGCDRSSSLAVASASWQLHPCDPAARLRLPPP
jgi:hypothetical protein